MRVDSKTEGKQTLAGLWLSPRNGPRERKGSAVLQFLSGVTERKASGTAGHREDNGQWGAWKHRLERSDLWSWVLNVQSLRRRGEGSAAWSTVELPHGGKEPSRAPYGVNCSVKWVHAGSEPAGAVEEWEEPTRTTSLKIPEKQSAHWGAPILHR